MLRKGDTGTEVQTLQEMLIACGYSCGPYGADGDFGSATHNALTSFQKDNGLEVDGIYGPMSKAALESAYNSKSGKKTDSSVYGRYINSTGTHYISNSGSDENGSYKGGSAGDQTGREWCMRTWYNRPWSCVLRYPDQKVALKIAELSIAAALNDKIGYDQWQRDTYWQQLKKNNYDPAKITAACEADCSAGVCANVRAAGYIFGIKALQNHGGTYTGDMRSAFKKAGFQVLTESKYLSSPDYLLPGDILLNDAHHTATNVTVGSRVKKDWESAASTNIAVATQEKTSSFPKYNLTEAQLKGIARLCQQEQGSVAGAKAEASLMANQLETSKSRQKKYGTGASGLYNWVRNGKWFARAAHWMDNGSVSASVLAGVKDVLVNGNRTLPLYVDEHDCLSDIQSISTGSVKDRSAYIQGKTIIKNRYGSAYTFWCFPDTGADPFGYTDDAYKAVAGGSSYKVRINIPDLNCRKGPSTAFESYGYIAPGEYTVIEEQDGWGHLKDHGWVSLNYTERI